MLTVEIALQIALHAHSKDVLTARVDFLMDQHAALHVL